MRILSVMLFCLSFSAGFSQGYFGKNFLIEFGANGSAPLFQNVFYEKGFVEKNGQLHKSYFLKDYGFRFALGQTVDEGMAICLEYDYRNYQINPLRGGELNRQYSSNGSIATDYIHPKVAFLDMEEHVFMLKYLIQSNEGIVPAGFIQEIGIGYTMTNIRNSSVMVSYGGTGAFSPDSISENLVDPGFEELRGLTFMYGAKMNFPITKSLLFGIGVRYNYNALFGKRKFRKQEESEAWLSGREMWSRTNQRRQLGIISLGMGFTLCF